MEILHVSAECYPVAKAGGLGDVVGALPKYQQKLNHTAKVVMPMYRTKFLYDNSWDVVHKGGANLGNWWFEYTVIKERTNKLEFELYLIDINGLLDREKIYSYDDDTERFISFQIAVVDWLSSWDHKPDVVHVHDYHTGLVPFMLKHCYNYQHLSSIPSVITIHNAQYQGAMGWDKSHYIPHWDGWQWGTLDWKDSINPLACGIKAASRVTTVSWSYLEELRYMSNGLENLFEYERGKSSGILNGIDTIVWNPASDTYLDHHYSIDTVDEGKLANKKILCDTFHLDIEKPLIIFIGRLVGEKAADLLPQVIGDSIYYINHRMNFLVLGSGDYWVEQQLEHMRGSLHGHYNAQIGYNEKLSHLMYAGADFLLMPSRVEPCGLNQMYAMRYGTVPIVRRTGGLKDTVIDYGDPQGYGVCFNHAAVGDITNAVYRAVQLYDDKERMQAVRRQIMELDFSWDRSAQQYIDIYENITGYKDRMQVNKPVENLQPVSVEEPLIWKPAADDSPTRSSSVVDVDDADPSDIFTHDIVNNSAPSVNDSVERAPALNLAEVNIADADPSDIFTHSPADDSAPSDENPAEATNALPTDSSLPGTEPVEEHSPQLITGLENNNEAEVVNIGTETKEATEPKKRINKR